MRSFKDVGTKFSRAPRTNTKEEDQPPIGVKTPLKLDNSGKSLFVMNYDLKSQIEDNLRNLLQTNWGERLTVYDYGANLAPLCFEYSNKDDFDDEAIIRINSAITKWIPFVTPISYGSEIERDDGRPNFAKVSITLIYSVPRLGVSETQMVAEIFVGG